jgi:5-methylthioadenosine/S-adenosylhomocysteine deaminase
VPGTAAALLPSPLTVTGHLVTFDPARPEIPKGAMYIDPDGRIEAVQARSEAPPRGYEHANAVSGGVVYPGLIDLHNHIAYNCLALWIAPDRHKPWTSRDQWPNDPDYKPSVSLPANALCQADGKAVLKYAETKAVVGGVTAIQGSAKVAHPFEGWMVRNVELETFGTGHKSVNQSVRPLSTVPAWDAAKADLQKGNAFLYHLAEGTDPKLLKDFAGLLDHHVLAPKFLGIHSTALTKAQFADWHVQGGSVVWSPFSNLWLYGETTHVEQAARAGMRICLGADWSPSGSKSLLGELKVADLYNREQLGGVFEAPELCAMATSNPADALGWDDRLGRLKAGLHGDFVMMRDRGDDPYRTLIQSTERDVQLVAINGYPMYGTNALMRSAAAVNPEPIAVSPTLSRTITLRDARIADADMSWPQVLAALEAARANPHRAKALAIDREGGEEHLLTLRPDKEWDDPELHPELLHVDGVAIPALDTLTHDAAYFDRIAKEPLHAGRLDGLRTYYAV